jgi:hypothetical protein
VERQLCLLHANCQGEPLMAALSASPDFAAAYAPRGYLNYARRAIPQADLDACRLFLYQQLGPEWGDLSSQSLLARLPKDCRALCIPNMFFRGPWPLWSGAPGFDYRDVLLDRLIDMGLPARDILHVCLRAPLTAKYDLAALLDETIAIERRRQASTPVPYLDFVLENFRTRPLYFTVNHPGAELLSLAASGILARLGLGPMAATFELPPEYAAFELPVHPQVAEAYGLAYGREGATFNVYGRRLSFEQYAAAYVDCRLRGMTDFIGYLLAA